jgi:hypothetical protein
MTWNARSQSGYRPRRASPGSSVIIIKNLMGEPDRRIDVDPDGNMTEYRWVKIENGEQGDEESDPSPGASR